MNTKDLASLALCRSLSSVTSSDSTPYMNGRATTGGVFKAHVVFCENKIDLIRLSLVRLHLSYYYRDPHGLHGPWWPLHKSTLHVYLV